MNHCTDADLIDYLHGELDEAADARLHYHLAACAACRTRLDAESELTDLLRAAPFAQERELPAFVRAGVWAAIRTAEPTWADRLRAALRPIVLAPIAAAALVAALLGLPVLHAGHDPAHASIPIFYYLDEHAAEALQNPLSDHLPAGSLALATPVVSAARSPLIDAAGAATLDDLVARR